jgi:hypothetical protein
MSASAMIVAFIVSTLGLSFFVFGKRQRRAPQLVAGILMMASPFIVPDPVWGSLTAVVIVCAMVVAVRRGV